MGMSSKNWKHLLEISVALEITKSERDHLRSQINMLQEQLNKAEARAERAEARLHQTTILMSDLSRQAIVAQSSTAFTEILMDGRSILRLNNPVPAE
jgi:predicted  nucleic acid-binding Zn-ribbon protein